MCITKTFPFELHSMNEYGNNQRGLIVCHHENRDEDTNINKPKVINSFKCSNMQFCVSLPFRISFRVSFYTIQNILPSKIVNHMLLTFMILP